MDSGRRPPETGRETHAPPAGQAGAGRLLVVATPIGNLGDITASAAEALAGADLIAAEDTRRTRILLGHLGVNRPLLSYRAHNQARKGAELVAMMKEGKILALVTDAGTPGISDPGFMLVRETAAAGIPVRAVPGASAITAALSISGFPSDRFVFEGFPPAKKGRSKRLAELAAEPRTVGIYESPHRVLAALAALAGLCPERPVMVARELTKVYEEVFRGTAAEVEGKMRHVPPRGEYVIILGPLPGRRHPSGPPDRWLGGGEGEADKP